jgi:hypothetical protein
LSDERAKLLDSIAKTIGDYREGELPRPTPDHVERWIEQFDADVQVPLLGELDHVFGSTYMSREKVADVFAGFLHSPKVAGRDPKSYWTDANFLNIQAKGKSQRTLLRLFDECLSREFGLRVEECGREGGSFVYLDDVLFSGSRVGTDLSAWIAELAPAEATVQVIVVAAHTLGIWQTEERLKQVAADAGKKVVLAISSAESFENRLKYKDESAVLWPTALPDDPQVRAYAEAEEKFPFQPRKPGGKIGQPIFSSEDGRQLLERELLRAGVHIRDVCKSPATFMRPLGFSDFALGFGSMIVTYRNCPNNCPLALWWGKPDAAEGTALDWYPLVARNGHAQNEEFE